MKVTANRTISTTGANRRPGSGDATFSDGRTFGWLRMPEQYGGGIRFFSRRSTHQGTASSMISFDSPKREAALDAYLNA
jgi:hypothetical protein